MSARVHRKGLYATSRAAMAQAVCPKCGERGAHFFSWKYGMKNYPVAPELGIWKCPSLPAMVLFPERKAAPRPDAEVER